MRVVDLAGSPHDIGFGHGAALSDAIGEHLDRWYAALSRRGVGDPVGWAGDLVDGGGWVDAVRSLAPEIAEEVEAIGEGAGCGHHGAWLLQLLDESWARLAGRHAEGLGCSSYGVVHGMRSWTGQTMDLEGFRQGLAAVLRIRPTDGPAVMVLTMAGCVGLLGASSARFGVVVNALAQVPAAPTGMPVAAIVRHLLAQPGFAAAVAALDAAPHATGQHYLVSCADRIASFECSPLAVVPVMTDSMRIWHTNHPLVGYLPEPDDAESEARWDAMTPTMRLPGWGLKRSCELLAQPPLCRLPAGDDATSTFAAAVIEHASWGTQLWVAGGPPAADRWTQVEW